MVMPVAEMEMMRTRGDGGGNVLKIEFVEVAVLVDIRVEPWTHWCARH